MDKENAAELAKLKEAERKVVLKQREERKVEM
jgi:hypothetical protein